MLRVDGLHIEVSGLDAIDGTPVLDIKPVMTGFAARGEVREPGLGHRADGQILVDKLSRQISDR